MLASNLAEQSFVGRSGVTHGVCRRVSVAMADADEEMSSPAGAEAVEKSLEPVAEEVVRPCGDSTQGSIASGDVQDRQTAKTWPGGMQACVLDLVAARADNGEFPCVRPEDYTDGQQQEVGKHYILFLLQTEFVEIQTFLDARMAAFMATKSLNEDIPQKVHDAKYMYEQYYNDCRHFYLQKCLEGRDFVHRMQDNIFLPVFPMAVLVCEAKRKAGQEVMVKVRQQHLAKIDEMLWDQFNRFWAVVAHGESDQLSVFVKFVEASYVDTVKGVVERDGTSRTEGFHAVYAVSAGGVSSAVQRARKELICQAVAEDADMVEVQLKTQFADSMAAVPTECRSLVPLTASADFRKNTISAYWRMTCRRAYVRVQ